MLKTSDSQHKKENTFNFTIPILTFATDNFRCLKQDQIGSMPLTNGFLISKDKMLFWDVNTR